MDQNIRSRTKRPLLQLDQLESRDVPAGNIALQAFHDLNANNTWDAGEAGVENATLSYYAADQESTNVTISTDNSGGVVSGIEHNQLYLYGVSVPAGWALPGGGNISGGTFTVAENETHTIALPLQQLNANPSSTTHIGEGHGSGSGSGSSTGSGTGSSIESGTGSGSGLGTGTGSGTGSSSGSGGGSGSGSSSGPGNAYPEMAMIGNLVFNDLNSNGLQDAGESGVANVMVRVEEVAGGAPLATDFTNANGEYSLSFWAYSGQSYRVKIEIPANHVVTTPNVGLDDEVDSDFDASGYSDPFMGGQWIDDDSIDAGLISLGSGSGSGSGSGTGSSTGTGIGSGSGTGTGTGSGTGSSMNVPPMANFDSYMVKARPEGVEPGLPHRVIGNVLSNDSDFNNDPLTANLLTGPLHGTLEFNSDGSFTYTPNAGYVGLDTFTYEAHDGQIASNPSWVWFYVMNNAPTSSPDSYTTPENTPLVVPANGLLTNDSDPDGDTITAQLVAGPQHGTVSINANGSFTYTPTANYEGFDYFTYQATDGLTPGNVTMVMVEVIAAKSATSLSVSSSNATATYGTDLTLTAQLSTLGTEEASPTGIISFTIGNIYIGSSQIIDNVANIQLPEALDVGMYQIEATYLGDQNWLGSNDQLEQSISAAQLTIAADDHLKIFGDPIPVLTYSVAGFANGDSNEVLSGELATTAQINSIPGTYSITQGTLSANSNYTILYYQGTLTIPETTGSISGKAWSDEDNNGLLGANEGIIKGVKVRLLSNGQSVATQSTNVLGQYSFTNLNLGTYSVKFEDIGSARFTIQNNGNDEIDSDVSTIGGTSDELLVSAGDHLAIDAGIAWPSIVGISASSDGVEGGDHATFTLTRSKLAGELSVPYTISSGRIGDLNAAVYSTGIATFSDGIDYSKVTVSVTDDALYQPSRWFTIKLADSQSSYQLSDQFEAEVRIEDNELASKVWIESASTVEYGETGFFVIKRTSTANSMTVDFQIDPEASTAQQGIHYQSMLGTVTFASGSDTANIEFQTFSTGHDGLEKLLSIQLTAAFEVNQIPEVTPKGPAAKLGKPNRSPIFNVANKKYDFSTGQGLKVNEHVGQVSATDPDMDPIIYSIASVKDVATQANVTNKNYFAINPTNGRIIVNNTLPSQNMDFVLEVRATDVPGGLFDTATVTIKLKPVVIITGDFQAVKGNTDTITLIFARLNNDLSKDLEVTYTVVWSDTVKNAIETPNDLNLVGNNGKITIPKDKRGKSIVLVAKAGGRELQPLSFTVSVTATELSDYVTTPYQQQVELNYDGQVRPNVGNNVANCIIYDKITLFGAYNSNQNLKDDSPIGVDLNDIRQESTPNCWFLASVAAVVRQRPDDIVDAMKEQADGTVRVRFYRWTKEGIRKEEFVTVPLKLEMGNFQAGLSGDKSWATNNPNDDFGFEVWPQILEQAYAKFTSEQSYYQGQFPNQPLQALTGVAYHHINLGELSDADASTLVRQVAQQGKAAALSTKSQEANQPPYWTLAAGNKLYRNHAYSITGLNNDRTAVLLHNPWGTEHVTIPLADIRKYFSVLDYRE